MNFTPTDFNGVVLVEPRLHPDDRGWFFEAWNRREFAAAGIDTVFVQDNHSRSRRGTVRGLHFQIPPRAQAKLVRVAAGEIFDVIVVLRRNSPTRGQWRAFTLSAENRRMLYIPVGFAHGFAAVSEYAEVLYKCSDFYAPETARGIRWDDPDLAIDWPVDAPLLSANDRALPLFRDSETEFDQFLE
jgi:dTDP-4-dehydrorhamnose 3,5-epimerase